MFANAEVWRRLTKFVVGDEAVSLALLAQGDVAIRARNLPGRQPVESTRMRYLFAHLEVGCVLPLITTSRTLVLVRKVTGILNIDSTSNHSAGSYLPNGTISTPLYQLQAAVGFLGQALIEFISSCHGAQHPKHGHNARPKSA